MLGIIICYKNIREAREMTAEVILLYVGGSESNKNQRYTRRKESGLGEQAHRTGLPKQARTREARTLTNDLG
jgi:hypothetical protein